jgi:KfrB protein
MKQRLLVMNGQRIVQIEQMGTWKNQKVGKSREIKPGIYNLFLAQNADKSQSYDGVVIHTSVDAIYQQVGKNCVIHARLDFDRVPEVGKLKIIRYGADGKAQVGTVSVKMERSYSLSRC